MTDDIFPKLHGANLVLLPVIFYDIYHKNSFAAGHYL
jgi:hypothetical protein